MRRAAVTLALGAAAAQLCRLRWDDVKYGAHFSFNWVEDSSAYDDTTLTGAAEYAFQRTIFRSLQVQPDLFLTTFFLLCLLIVT